MALRPTLHFFSVSDGNTRIWGRPGEAAGGGWSGDRLTDNGFMSAPLPSLGGLQLPQFTGTPQSPWIHPFCIDPKGQRELGGASGSQLPLSVPSPSPRTVSHPKKQGHQQFCTEAPHFLGHYREGVGISP